MARNSGYFVAPESYPAAVRAKPNRAHITHPDSLQQNKSKKKKKIFKLFDFFLTFCGLGHFKLQNISLELNIVLLISCYQTLNGHLR